MTAVAAPPGLTRSRGRAGVAALVGCLVVAAVAVIAWGGSVPTGRALDPTFAGASGARAVARVLAQRGVQVQPARSASEVEAAGVDAETTLVVIADRPVDAGGRAQIERARRAAGRIVVVGAGSPLHDLGFGVEAQPVGWGQATARDCRAPDIPDGAVIGPVDAVFRPTGRPGTSPDAGTARADSAAVAGCFAAPDGTGTPGTSGRPPAPDHHAAPDSTGAPATAYLLLRGAPGRADTVFFGAGGILANGVVERHDNAAAALRLLGHHPRLVWYLPESDTAAASTGRYPTFYAPVWAILGLVAVLGCLWRGRRFGPLVAEPLPVVVPADETVIARARLYRRARDRAHVDRLLRGALPPTMREHAPRDLRLLARTLHDHDKEHRNP